MTLFQRAGAVSSAVMGLALLATPAFGAASADWVEKSNAHTQVVLDVLARFSPEGAAGLGVDGYDEGIIDLKENLYERSISAFDQVMVELKARRAQETDPLVRQDIEILIKAGEDNRRSNELNRKFMLPYTNISRMVFFGVRSLLDAQVAPERHPAVLVRLRKYAGMEKGYTPIVELAKARTIERFDVPGLMGPVRTQVEQDLERSEQFIGGIEQMLEGSDLKGWKRPYKKLAAQLREYNEWVKAEIIPRAREDFRLPRDMYADALHNWGVDESPEALIETATRGYADIRNEMQALAPLVAKEQGFATDDYREVIRQLKKKQIPGDELLAYYRMVLGKLEEIILAQGLVSLPERDAGIRIASEAETAAQPAPHLQPPRLIGNTGEYPEFVLPQLQKNEDGSWKGTDDTYEAGTWTLTAHEARPGHELQFSAMVESGVSVARAVFAFNSANVEGWALYAEAIAKPFMPLDAQMISLQYRLMRAARMFLDPMLNLGLISVPEAKRLLMEDVGVDEGWAQNEMERYTYRMPGQATAYFYGYGKLQALRTQTELALRDNFDAGAFHDFVLSQGLLPPDLLKKAVMEEFVPSAMAQNVPGSGSGKSEQAVR